ncbi:MAG: hypothetical protein ACOX7W_03175 [Christensenellales bacterium]|jgi:neutral ceramidase
MKAAATMIDITPPIGISLCGNIREDNIARGVHDPLYCNALLLETGGVRTLLLVLDWLGVEDEDATLLRSLTAQAAGTLSERVIVSATHTHSGPRILALSGPGGRSPGEEAYLRQATERIVSRVRELPESMEPVSLWRAQSQVNTLSFNRRLRLADGSVRMNWMPVDPDDVVGTTGPIDPALTVVGIRRAGGDWLALIANFALHAAVLVGQDWLWSADYVYYLRKTLREALPGNPVIHFTNGAEGDVNHLNYRDPRQMEGFPEAERIGTELGFSALGALSGAVAMQGRLTCVTDTVILKRRTIPEGLLRWARRKWERCGGKIPSLHHGIPDECYARDILHMARFAGREHAVPMTAMLLGDVAAVTLPGEIFCQIGLNIKKASPIPNTFLMGLSQGYCGYIPDAKAFLEGGYEPRTRGGSRFAEDSCDRIEAAANALLMRL